MEEPISPSCIDPIEPDNRPRMDRLISHINYEISRKNVCDEIRVNMNGLYICEDEMKQLVDLYQSKGWFCYFHQYLTLCDCTNMILNKHRFDRKFWSIGRYGIDEHKLIYLLPYCGFIDKDECQRAFNYETELRLKNEQDDKKNKSWFDKLFN